MNAILDALQFRHACKQFDPDKKITPEQLNTILECARLSPTSFGMEAWKFLVIEDRLGAINQSLLSIKAVESEGLMIRAVILNQLNEISADILDNLADLKKRTHYPVYSCTYNGLLEVMDLT